MLGVFGKRQSMACTCSGRLQMVKRSTTYVQISEDCQPVAVPKHRLIFWLLMQGRMLTGQRLRQCGMHISEIHCVFCCAVKESAVHLFSNAKLILKEICDWARIQQFGI